MATGTAKAGIAALFVLLLLVLPPRHSQSGDGARVTLFSGKRSCAFTVELARTPDQHERGLMFRKTLARDRGMLFLFPEEASRYFWMKNTLIPLDIIFVDSRRTVVDVHHGARPLDETIIASRKPARYVLEVAAGMAGACSVAPGSRLTFHNFSD